MLVPAEGLLDVPSTGELSRPGTMPDNIVRTKVDGLDSAFDTTMFYDDGNTNRKDESMVAHRDEIYNSINDPQMTEQSIKDYLAKPIQLATGNFSTSDTYSFFNSISMPYTALKSAQGAMYYNKLAGYFGAAFDMRFRLTINANQFQQGRYCIGWVPLCSPASTTSALKNLAFNNTHMATLVQRTTVHHVEIDVNTQTSAELLVPFTSPHNFYPLNSIWNSIDSTALGYINVYPYVPLVSPAGSTIASYTLWVSFENVRLFGAASPQSGLSDKEVSNKENGPISGVARAFSKGFKEFAHIPLLSSYASSISWVADRIAVTSAAFGFSKPTQGDSISKVALLNNSGHSNVDGDSEARSLALYAKPGVVTVDGISGTKYDEMDFSYIARRYAWFDTFTWSTGTTASVIKTYSVSPSIGINGTGGAYHFTPLTFLTDQFHLWRGSIKFRFKLVKTIFHSGRLSVAFYPGDEYATLTADPWFVNRMIIDIRENNEFEVIVPYVSRTPWRYAGDSIGSLQIAVVDQLVAPATVSTDITIVTEICGGDDFEVSVPIGFDFMPTTFVPQSGMPDEILSTTIGNSSINANPTVSTATCIGDKVTNLRALLKRFTALRYRENQSGFILNTQQLAVCPDVIMALSSSSTDNYHFTADHFSIWACCYGMVRGGIRLKDVVPMGAFTTTGSSTTLPMATKSPLYVSYLTDAQGQTTTPINGGGPTTAGINYPGVIQTLDQNNTVVVEVPQYTTAYARSTVDMFHWQEGASYLAYNQKEEATTTRGKVQFTVPTALYGARNTGLTNADHTVHNLYRSLADDASFHVFISVPAMLNIGSTIKLGYA